MGLALDMPWAITPEKIELAIQRIVAIEQPRQVVVFGSAVRGDTTVDSDIDLLVVTADEVDSPRRESVRIRRALRGISMPIDILVISEQRLQELANVPGLIYREALRHGRIVYDSAEEKTHR